jgi:hypothetical protein
MNALNIGGLLAMAAVTASCNFPAGEALAHEEHTTATPVTLEAAGGPGKELLQQIRQATEKYRDVNVALAEGFIAPPGNICDTAEMMGQPKELGAMGIHYFRPDLLGITQVEPRVDGNGTHTDYFQPAILIYEPQADGSLELVAIENLVFVKSWLAKNAAVPTFHGVHYNLMADDPTTPVDEAHHFEPHFDLHMWLYRENPNGLFAQYNPTVSCEHAPNAGKHAAH